ncbi:MAG: ROK family transcriptional regulator [Anaerolineae bacterium]|nr:ROK family transcriptional regulator [Anaerolineae bacterium]
MSRPRRGNQDLIKALNRNLILNIVRRQGPLSQTQIHKISHLSVGAVSQITNELLHENWLIPAGESDYTGGRRQSMLRLNPHAGCVVGLKLMEDRVVCAITNLEANVLHYADTPLTYDHSTQAISQALVQIIQQVIRESGVKPNSILGVGIGLAGVIDTQQGIVQYSPYFHWKNVPLARLLSEHLLLPIYLENDVNTLTVAEQLFGPGHNVENFVVITIGRGIGMGMVIHHQLYQGARGGVGELGHITVEVGGTKCDCGKYGCLEAMAADPKVIEQVENAFTLSDVIAAAEQGSQQAREALAKSGFYLGMGIATVINLLHPSLVILSGEGVIAGDLRLTSMFQALNEHTFNGLLESVEMIIKPADDRTWAQGAASIVVSKLFESPLVEENIE